MIIILASSILDRLIPRHKTSRPESNDFKIQTICRGFPERCSSSLDSLHLRFAPVPGNSLEQGPDDSPSSTSRPTGEGFQLMSH